MRAKKSADPSSTVMCGISITFSVTVLHPIKTHWIENTVVEVPLCSLVRRIIHWFGTSQSMREGEKYLAQRGL